jgi:hypothetical protein
MAKLTCLGFGYELWANITKDAIEKLDDILKIMEDIKLLRKSRNTSTQLGMQANHFLWLLSTVPWVP